MPRGPVLLAETGDNSPQSPQAQAPVEPGRHDKIRLPPLFGVRHLLLQDCGKPALRHSGPTQHALALQHRGGGYNDHIVATSRTPTFVQKWDIEHSNRLTPCPGLSQKPLFGLSDHWVQDALKPGQCLRIAEYPLAEPPAVNPAILIAHSRESRFDPGDGSSTRPQQAMNHSISVEQRHTHTAQHRSSSTFSHPDRTGQADDEHLSASTC